MNKLRLSVIIACATLLWSGLSAQTNLTVAAQSGVSLSKLSASVNVCGSVGQSDSSTTFPTVDLTNCPADTVAPPPRKPWQPIKVIPTSTCVDWLLYHTNQGGNWGIFRFGELPDKPKADNNISKGKGKGVVDMSPSRSPDNQWVAFASNRTGNWEIYVGSIDGTIQQRVTYATTAANLTPMWSPDGKTITFVSTRTGTRNLFAFDVTTGTETALTQDSASSTNPYWSSDSSKLLYQSDSSGKWQITELTLAGLSSKTLSDGTANDMNPAFSPDGKMIAFRSFRGGNGNNGVIMVMNSDGSKVTAISDANGNALNQVWSADSSLIAYQSSITGSGDIYVYQLSTGKTRRVTDNDVPDYSPTWRCNAPFIVFTSEIGGSPALYQTSALPMNNRGVKPEDVNQLSFDTRWVDLFPENSPAVEDSSARVAMGIMPR